MTEYLKIKDGVDLKELEKFGFEYAPDKEYEDAHYYAGWLTITCHDKRIIFEYMPGCNWNADAWCMCKLYDLIQAGLVEKVVEND